MRHSLRQTVGLFFAVIVSTTALAAKIERTGNSVPGEVLVKIRAAASANDVAALGRLADADEVKRVSKLTSGAIYRMHSRSKSADAVAAALAHNPNVEYVEPNFIMRLVATPNDTSYANLWGLKNTGQSIGGSVGTAGADIDAESAWNVTTGSASIVVGVVDTGIDYNHPDLAANIWSNPGGKGSVACAAGTHGFNAITGTCNPLDDEGHGTHVAGTIGAVGNNGLGVTGVNWTTSIMALKFLGYDGYGTTAGAIEAIDFAVQAKIDGVNVRVLSNSWGGGAFSKALLDVINKANEHDILFVAAAGNDFLSNDLYPHYPSNYATPNMISVAATDNRDGLAWFSNYGAKTVHLAAPGVYVLSTVPGGGYEYLSGTSMATPHVAGVAALLLAQTPSLTTAQVKQTLLSTVDPIPSVAGITVAGGRLNAAKALGAPAEPDFTITVTPTSRSVARGGSASYAIAIDASGGFNGTVSLSVAGVPPNATSSFNPASTTTSSTLLVNTTNLTTLGTASMTITGTSGQLTRSVPISMTVLSTPPPTACPSFTAFSSLSHSVPTAVAIGDFNRDGKADLATVETASSRVHVRGGAAFASAGTFSVGNTPLGIATGDFNRDGRLDLITANSGSHDVSVLLGNGDNTFGTAVHYPAGTSPFHVATGDFNGDGKLDAAVANNGSSSVSILLGQGDGTLGTAANFGAGSGPFWVTPVDLDRDGKLDLAVANFNDHDISVLRGNGDGTFQTAVDTAVGTKPSSIAAADIDRDGNLDLAISNYESNNVSLLSGNGIGGFVAAPASFPVGSRPYSVAAGDFNGDGMPDLVTANSNASSVSLLMNTGTGFTSTTLNSGSGPSHAAAGDLNGDGRTDIAVANQNSGTVVILRNTGTCSVNCGTLASPTQYATGTGPDSVATGDINRDGLPDLFVVNNGSNTVSVLLGSLAGGFTAGQVAPAGTGPHGIATGDFNRDGKPDLAVGNPGTNKVLILIGLDGGVFMSAVEYAAGTTPRAVSVGDLNRDGNLDLAVAARGADAAAILLGNGDGTFNAPVTYGAGDDPEAIAIGDFDRDGILDLAVANSVSGNVSILRGNGNGTFGSATNIAVGTTPYSIVAGDLNADGKPDLAVANVSSSNVSILIGNGNATFAAAVHYATGTSPYAVAVADFNGDGKLDLATANAGSGNVSILFATEPGVFGSPVNTSAAAIALASNDFNRDGKPDLAVVNSGSGSAGVLLNTCPIPDLTVTKSHSDTFTQGSSNKTYTITVTNSGGTATTAPVNVTDTLPAGLSPMSMSGTGWTCTTSPLSCSRADALAAGASYPPITLAVRVAGNAPASVTNTVAVSGGGELNALNSTASDQTTIAPATDVIVLKSHTGAFAQGSQGRTYSIRVRNLGGLATTGTITVTDTLPAGLTASAMSGDGWNCTLGTLTCTRSDSLAAGASYPVITLTVNVGNAAPQIVNTATVSGGGDANPSNNTANDPTIVWGTQSCGSFSSVKTYSTGGYSATGLVVGDFNADNRPDVAATTYYGQSVAVLLGNAGGTLATAVTYAVPNYPRNLATADLDNDGDLDLLASADYGLYVLLGNGNGTFAAAVRYVDTATSLAGGIAIGDLNSDGNPDVAVVQTGSPDQVLVLLGNGNGTLQAPVGYATNDQAHAVAISDFDGNGAADLAVTRYGGVAVFPGNGDGTFGAFVLRTTPYSPSWVTAGDFNSDGRPDLATVSYSYGVVVMLGIGDGTFHPGTLYATYGSDFVTATDINGDGRLDLAIAKYSYGVISTFTGNGDGTFQPEASYPVSSGAVQVAVSDFNADGKADFAASLGYSGVGIMLGGCPELTITKTHSGDFRGNFIEQYQITVKNTGTAFSSGTITVKDILPSGLTITDMYGNYPWNCDEATVTCTTTSAIAGGAQSTITLNVKVSVDAPSSVTNIATVSGGGDIDPSNNTASDPTTIVHVPDLIINKTHNGGAFTVGQTVTYLINVGNNGTGATSGSVTVTDNLPSALSATGMSGTGWTCNVGTRVCTRGDVLGATSAYPPITLTATVTNVYASSVTNIASVSGGNDNNLFNNTAYDPTSLVVPPAQVNAVAASANTVSVTWSGVPGATTYEVWRATSSSGGYSLVATTVSSFYVDRNVTPNTAYLYKVRALEGSTIGPMSDPDLATTVIFTDDPLVAGTSFKTAHILQLRAAVNAVRAAAGMAPATFTDATLSSGGAVRASHITDLRTALHAARIALGFATPFYSDPALAAGYTIRMVHVTELRAYVK